MAAEPTPTPVTTFDDRHRLIQSRFPTSDPSRALDIITSYDREKKSYVSRVRGVRHLEAGTAFTHAQDAIAAGHEPIESARVGRYSLAAHRSAADAAVRHYLPQLAWLLTWAENP